MSEIDDAVDRIIAGMEGRPLTDGRSKRLIAYHEVGHALACCDDVSICCGAAREVMTSKTRNARVV